MQDERAGPQRPGTGEPGVDAALAGPGERPGTGEPRVDAALAGLDELPGLPVTVTVTVPLEGTVPDAGLTVR